MVPFLAVLLFTVSSQPVLEIRHFPAPLAAGWSVSRGAAGGAPLEGRLPEGPWLRFDPMKPASPAFAGTSWLRMIIRLEDEAFRQPLALRLRPLFPAETVLWDGVALPGLPGGGTGANGIRAELVLELPPSAQGRHELLIRHTAGTDAMFQSPPVLDGLGRSLNHALAGQRPAAIFAVATGTLGFLCVFFFLSDRSRLEIGLYAVLAMGMAAHIAAAAPAWLPLRTGPRTLATLSFLLPPLTALVVLRFLDLRIAIWQRISLLLPVLGIAAVWIVPGPASWLDRAGLVCLALVTIATAVPLSAPAVRRRPETALIFVGAGLLLLAALVDAGYRLRVLLTAGPDLPAIAPAFLVFTTLLLLIVADQGQRLLTRATTDPLTNLSNRAEFWRRAERELQRAGRTERSLALVILDLDHFKSVNDTFGHPAGDKVLAAVAGAIAETLRGVDVSGRYGGEEFVILLVEVEETSAFQAVERVRAAIAALAPPRVARAITVSAGVALHQPIFERTTVRELVKRADAALYTSKRAGRNRTTVESTRGTTPTTAAEVRFR